MAVNYVSDKETTNTNTQSQDEKQINVSTSKLIVYFKSLISSMKRWNVCEVVQIIMVGLLLISEQYAVKINLVFGFFIPIYQHFVAITAQRHFTPANNSFSSPILNSYNLSKKFGPSSICLSSSSSSPSSSSFNSQNSLSSNSSTNSSVSINNEKKTHSIEKNANVNYERSLKGKLECAEDYNSENCINLSLRDDFCQKTLADDSNIQLTHAKFLNTSSSRSSLISTTNAYSETIEMKGFEQSLFTTPENIKLKNQIIMQKIDDQIKCYSKSKISLSKSQQPLKTPIVQKSFTSTRRVNN